VSHNVSLLFDVEDLCWPGSDDITLELAKRLTEHGLQGTFFVVAEKARQFVQRGRSDIIAALQKHDVASHTTRHSIHPTIAEYLSETAWDEGVYQAMEDEGLGLEILEQVFGRRPTAWGQPGGSWGPQINAAMARLQMPVVVYPRTRIERSVDIHWYAGSLVFPDNAIAVFDTRLTDEREFEQAVRQMVDLVDQRILAGARWTGIFVCHPTMLKAQQFWDGLNYAQGLNTDPKDYRLPTFRSQAAYQTALKNYERLLDILQQDRRLHIQTIADLHRLFRPPEETVYFYQIDQAIPEILKYEDLPTNFYHFSAAELLDLVARAYTNTDFALEALPRRAVLGPIDEPPPTFPHDDYMYWDDFLTACRTLVYHVTDSGHLPSSVYVRGVQWSLGTFFRAAIEVWPQFRAGVRPNYLDWKPGYLYPAIGHDIAATVQDDYEGWPIHRPELDSNKLLMHTCFQCWTLRPAYE